MADDMKNGMNEDEYKFDEEYAEAAYPVQSPGMGGGIGKVLNAKRVFIVLGVIIIIYVVIRVIEIIEHKRTPTPATTTTAQVMPPKTTQQQQPVQQQPSFPQQLPINTEEQQRMQQIQIGVANLDARMYNIQVAIGDLNSTVGRLENAIMQQVSIEQKREQSRLQVMQRRAKHLYHVYAIIPNRAWLEDAQGNTITVAPGGFLPGVGVVTTIDPDQGVVMTDQGVKIEFSSSDF